MSGLDERQLRMLKAQVCCVLPVEFSARKALIVSGAPALKGLRRALSGRQQLGCVLGSLIWFEERPRGMLCGEGWGGGILDQRSTLTTGHLDLWSLVK